MSGRSDWNPESYARFGGLRLRPALDLLAQVGELPKGDIVDLGCGNGAAGPALAARYAGRRIIGLDASPAMLASARKGGAYHQLIEGDAAAWRAEAPVALVFSNAALHWLSDHAALMPNLAAQLAPGGTLAVQMPRQYGAPSHRFLRDFAAEMFPDRFDLAAWRAPVSPPVEYHRMLSGLGRVNVWETDYVQRVEPVADGHPVRRFTESTAMRPYLDLMSQAEIAEFLARYEAALAAAYPIEPDGSVLFPFRRLFFTLTL
ncbi:methyltransferase domain-containing protein [Defluviimonas sp. SAOS-178_SWC]|uniref:methyltransferase domain-containing protein n=1 Tax=Defluviimonas sp. SAOS-178_SWC TaxID=3121287 RepID=UPI0032217757